MGLLLLDLQSILLKSNLASGPDLGEGRVGSCPGGPHKKGPPQISIMCLLIILSIVYIGYKPTILDCVCLGLRVKDYFLIRAKFPGLWCVLTVHAHLLVVRMSNSTKFLLYFIVLHLGPTKFKRPLLDCKFSEFGNLQIFRK